jgi:phytoene dehydrogenase-like protein
MAQNTYNTIIIGAGIAGLTAAAYLSRAGQKVLLIEKNKELGGLVNSFTREGFHFDAGARALEDAGIIFPMLQDLDIHLEVIKNPVTLGIENEIINIEGVDSLVQYQELLRKLYPESENEIINIIKRIRKIMKQMNVLYSVENPVFKNLKRDRTFLFKKLLPWLPKFIFTIGKINRMNTPVEDYLQTIIQNPSLRDIIAQHFFKRTPTFFALGYFCLYLNYFYPKGGTGKLSEVLKNKILEFGTNLVTETKIIEIVPDRKLVIDDKNICYHYDNLIWCADLKTFYKIVKTEGLSFKIKTNFEQTKNKILQNRGTDSVFSLFLGVNEPLESFKKITKGHFFYTPSKTGLGKTHTEELNYLLANFEKVTKEHILTWLDKFTKLNTYEISIPGLKDPELVASDKTGIIISLLVEYDLFRKVQQAGWLNEFVTEFENRIIGVISDSVYPMLKNKITMRFSISPLNIENRVGSSEGSIVGWAFQKSMPVINKIQFANKSVLTPIPTIYQAGQWAYSPAGVPMSILTGKLAADKILKKWKHNFLQTNHNKRYDY